MSNNTTKTSIIIGQMRSLYFVATFLTNTDARFLEIQSYRKHARDSLPTELVNAWEDLKFESSFDASGLLTLNILNAVIMIWKPGDNETINDKMGRRFARLQGLIPRLAARYGLADSAAGKGGRQSDVTEVDGGDGEDEGVEGLMAALGEGLQRMEL